ncbi:MAG: tRNA 5-methoxyuridine(34)/uridine 5-oxyacetic acid(34) synthase CmoB [Gammaproteobacteria bacterium]
MIDYSALFKSLSGTPLERWSDVLQDQVKTAFSCGHGDWPKWQNLASSLPVIKPSAIDLNTSCIQIGRSGDCDTDTLRELESILKLYHPWRKGPFSLFGIHIDAEWRSDLKWNRLKYEIGDLTGKCILDAGCSNGYHALHMYGSGASLVVGIDPTLLYVYQFYALKHFLGEIPIHVLPLGVESLPEKLNAFDVVFSMGVFYHRRSPIDHILELKHCLHSGGELVLETLVIDGENGDVLLPEGRYAKMRNVWFIPSCKTLLSWLKRCGFRDSRIIDVSDTTVEEQRSTDWMTFESLQDFLSEGDSSRTIEGYPAPKRAILMARV